MSSTEPPEFETGTAGASTRREHARRRANRHKRVHDKHPRIGGLMLALGDAPAHETAWARGASGEEHVAQSLAKHLNDGIILLHDRRIQGSQANIDHIAIAPSGVWVIDAKRYNGKVVVSTPVFGQPKLTIKGRDQSKLVRGLAKQVALVEAVMPEVARGVLVHGALCFVDADLPMLAKLTFGGYPLLYARPLATRINAPGPLAADHVRAVAGQLATRFPPA